MDPRGLAGHGSRRSCDRQETPYVKLLHYHRAYLARYRKLLQYRRLLLYHKFLQYHKFLRYPKLLQYIRLLQRIKLPPYLKGFLEQYHQLLASYETRSYTKGVLSQYLDHHFYLLVKVLDFLRGICH